METQGMKAQAHYRPVKAIVNIIKCQLTTFEESVLNNYLNFAMTMKQIPNLDLISPIKEVALKILKARADELRWKVKQALEKSKPSKPNISKEERLAIKSLSDYGNIILPANKDHVAVVRGKVEYSNKLADLIGSSGYCEIKKDLNLKTERTKISYHKWNTDS